jgi:hypothetical protein
MHPSNHGMSWNLTWGVLGLSFAVDGMVLRKAWSNAGERAQAANMTTMKWVLSFKVV